MRRVVTGMIRGYQLTLSPLLPPACRFYPTCSQYMLEAVQRYGASRGVWLGLKRLGRCHPLHPGGYDPVPDLDRGDPDSSFLNDGEDNITPNWDPEDRDLGK